MLKSLSILLLSLSCSFSLAADILSPEQALSRVNGSRSNIRSIRHGLDDKARLVHTFTNGSASENTVYIFENNKGQGFMAVSADDNTPAVLGYTDKGSFDLNNMPPQLSWLLGEYSNQIEYIRSNNIEQQTNVGDALEAIAPLVKTHWDQGTPYNNLCPDHNGKNSYTGCVATSMAQVMKYWNYPAIGTGSHQYTPNSIKKLLEIDFAEQSFDWDNMLEQYSEGNYDSNQAAAISWLMKACGHAVEMNYSSISSGALSVLVVSAMKDFFQYDDGITFANRMAYSASEWRKMMHDNLKNVGPIIYSGSTNMSGAHSFVCDGYDGEGRFHINWGWSGSSDGYFLLDLLSPDTHGIGGADAGYNFKQNAILGIRRPDGVDAPHSEPRLTQYGSLTASVTKGRTILFGLKDYSPLGWGSDNPYLVRLTLGGKLEPQGDTPAEVQYYTSSIGLVILNPGTYYTYGDSFTPSIKLDSSLPQGTYKLSLVTKDNLSGTEVWSPVIVPYGYQDYVTIVKGENGITAIGAEDPTLTVTDAEFISEVVYNQPLTVRATITNNTDVELTQGVSIVLLTPDGYRRFVGEGVNVTLKPGESVVKDITNEMYIMSGNYDPAIDTDFIFALQNPITTAYYGTFGNVKMSDRPAGESIVIADETSFTVISDRQTGLVTVSSLMHGSTVEIFTAGGVMVGNKTAKQTSTLTFDLDRTRHGIYIVKVTSPDGKCTVKKTAI